MKSRTLHVSIIGHPNNGLSILGEWAGQQEPRVQDVCQQKPVSMEYISSFSSLMSVPDRAHSLPGGNFQYPQMSGIITGLLEVQTIDPPFLPSDCRHNKPTGTGPRHHTPRKLSMRGRACSYPPVENAPEIDRLHLCSQGSPVA